MKRLTSLQAKRGRRRERQFLAEGVRLLEEALRFSFLPELIYYSPSDLSDRGQQLVQRFRERGVHTQTISAKECHKLSDTKAAQGILGLFALCSYQAGAVLHKKPGLLLIADRIHDPGNLGTLVRSAQAFGFGCVVTTGETAEAMNPKTVRASMGGVFALPVVEDVDAHDLLALLDENAYTIYCADTKGEPVGDVIRTEERIALIVGSEAHGLSETFVRAAHRRLRIPVMPSTESLNAAVAGSILMYLLYRKGTA
jgi:TrmH family RNA methyltransferase